MHTPDNIIICVGRQLGSGGHIIAKQLADTFGCKLYDREVLELAAQQSGFSTEVFEQNDEKKGFFESMFHVHVPFVTDGSFYDNGLSQENLFRLQSDAIRKAAEQEPCVFVGRCAEYVLRDHPRMVSVFVTANMDERVARVGKRHNCSADEARKIIEQQEARRSSYYNYYTGKQWGHGASYDLCVNSSLLGIEGTHSLVASFVRQALDVDR